MDGRACLSVLEQRYQISRPPEFTALGPKCPVSKNYIIPSPRFWSFLGTSGPWIESLRSQILGQSLKYFGLIVWVPTGSAITNGREPRSCLGRVFNSKLGRIASSHFENSGQGSSCQLTVVFRTYQFFRGGGGGYGIFT
jgi:hypothetical protein